MAYRTREQMQAETELAKRQSILEVAIANGYSFTKKGNYYIDDENHITIYPRTNSYFNFYEQKGGSTIDFLVNENGMTIRESIEWLVSHADQRLPGPEYYSPVIQSEKKNDYQGFVLPEKNSDNRRVAAYLTKSRYIDSKLVSELIHSHCIYEEKKHHNAIFVGFSRDGIAKHGFIHGTISDPSKKFKGDVYHSDKSYGFSLEGKIDTVIVFEAPIDLLSYKTLYPDSKEHLLAFGMTDYSPLVTYLKEYPEIKNIRCALDVDEAGRTGAEKIKNIFKELNVTLDPILNLVESFDCKDVNEYLVKVKTTSREIDNKSKKKVI